MIIRSLREMVGRVGIGLFILNLVVYLFRCTVRKGFYESHSSAMVICAEAGFIASLAVPLLVFRYVRKKWWIGMVVISLTMAYLWFSDITWWVMEK